MPGKKLIEETLFREKFVSNKSFFEQKLLRTNVVLKLFRTEVA
jgi:hypothetical protein